MKGYKYYQLLDERYDTLVKDNDNPANIPDGTHGQTAFRKRKALSRGKTEEAAPIAEPQGVEVDSGIVAYSEMRYPTIPDPERVVSDIQTDLDLRYGDTPRPEIDLESYRSDIAALNKA